MAAQGASMPSLAERPDAPKPTLNADAASKPKPCCVCKDEKAQRDECMLFSKTADPTIECKSTIAQYRSCMAGFGFQV
ncbi:cytochrome C oxidase copper chaperone-domain-containing protein [Microdochium bolleyi]|uniref:Cytochrome C oxidase copper chaperone-domain-containing protein n=1 Tax=Microdochium bolleyi TaxID=196109 RepID=A0A136JF49_9PEZI|nr:cytochrome C oxidase copper chaperone-domain-containing protein [Microdochium bolleyi]